MQTRTPSGQLAALVRRAQNGDRQAFDLLAEETRPVLLGLGRRWLGEPYLAEELAQETLLRAYERLHLLREPSAFPGWLHAIARNWARQRFRAQKATYPMDPGEDLPAVAPDPAQEFALHWDLLAALERLSPEQRSTADLCLVRQQSVAEAAARLGVSQEVVKGRLQRAREALRKELEEAMPETKTERAPLVLVVDDEVHIARLVQVNLEFLGYRVEVAHDGEAALTRARRKTPDLITLDLLMPRLDGWAVLRQLRSERRTLLTPILVLSVLPAEDPRNAICHELADDYWQKPFSPLCLQAWVDRRLGSISEQHARQLAKWRQVRFDDAATPERVVPYLASQQYALAQVEARVLLQEMGSAAIPALAEALRASDANLWHAAAMLLAQRDEDEAVAALVPLLSSSEQEKRWEALAAIGQMRSQAALLALADCTEGVFAEVVAALDDPAGPVQARAQAVLRRVRTPQAAAALRTHSAQSAGRVMKVGEDGSVSTVREE